MRKLRNTEKAKEELYILIEKYMKQGLSMTAAYLRAVTEYKQTK